MRVSGNTTLTIDGREMNVIGDVVIGGLSKDREIWPSVMRAPSVTTLIHLEQRLDLFGEMLQSIGWDLARPRLAAPRAKRRRNPNRASQKARKLARRASRRA